LPLTYRGLKAPERKKLAADALERVGMAHRSKHRPSQLSGGQQQRVAVARAVAGNPAILLADEPTGNLDSKSGESVMQLLAELHKAGATICMVTHDPRYARHATRAIHLFDGKLVDEATAVQAKESQSACCSSSRPLQFNLGRRTWVPHLEAFKARLVHIERAARHRQIAQREVACEVAHGIGDKPFERNIGDDRHARDRTTSSRCRLEHDPGEHWARHRQLWGVGAHQIGDGRELYIDL
jgi:energy-coupling factor transporter ATP-binding protein EcfA2